MAPPHWRRGVELGSQPAAIRSAWTALVTAVAGRTEIAWLTPLERLLLRENKMLQIAVANRLGIITPTTAVVSDPALIPAELGNQLVVKPLGAANYTDPERAEQVVWANPVDRDSVVLNQLAGAPFILQTHLEAERHLRVVTVGRSVWTCELMAEGLPIDWRREETAHESFVAASEPAVEDDAMRLAAALGIGYSSQDWIMTGGVGNFVDLNPAGQWMFLPDEVASAVTDAIALWLIG